MSKVCKEDTICGPCFDAVKPSNLQSMEIDLGNREPVLQRLPPVLNENGEEIENCSVEYSLEFEATPSLIALD